MSKTSQSVFLYAFCFLAVCVVTEETIRPVILIHGVTASYREFRQLVRYIKADFPTTQVFALEAYNFDRSLVSLLKQTPEFCAMMRNITDQYGDITLIGYSQGGIIARGMVEMGDNKNIHTFISLSAPGELTSHFFTLPVLPGS